jgi:hypothetical protein
MFSNRGLSPLFGMEITCVLERACPRPRAVCPHAAFGA